jgi:hypothetical protein
LFCSQLGHYVSVAEPELVEQQHSAGTGAKIFNAAFGPGELIYYKMEQKPNFLMQKI